MTGTKWMYMCLHERSSSKNKQVLENVIGPELVGRDTSKIIFFFSVYEQMLTDVS